MRFQFLPFWERDRTAVWVDIEGPSPNDHIPRVIRATENFYEHDLLVHLALRGPQGGIYIDVGANIGNHALFFARYCADQVIAVEPAAAIGAILRRNVMVNDLTNVTIAYVAVGAQGGGTAQLVSLSDGNLGMLTLSSTVPGETVRVETLDGLWEQRSADLHSMRVTLLKIDVEGLELEVLRGASGLLRHFKPQLVIEAATPAEKRELVSFLNPFGYRIAGQFCATPTYHFIDPSVHELRQVPPITRLRAAVARLRVFTRLIRVTLGFDRQQV